MRTTIDLPADLHSVLSSLASSNRSSLSQTAVAVMRRGLEVSAEGAASTPSAPGVSAVTGLPRVRMSRAISAEDVRKLEDEA